MGQGYIRQDTSNIISGNNIISADVFDQEFDQIVAAFNNSSGHTHDGSSAEGAPITVTGPDQEFIFDATSFYSKADNTYDIGKTGTKFKDLFLSGVADIDTLDVTNNTAIGGTFNVTGVSTFTDNVSASGNLEVTGAVTFSSNLSVAGDNTIDGTLSVVGSTSLSGLLGVTDAATFANNVSIGGNTEITGTLTTGTLTTSGNSSLEGDLSVTGNTELSGNLTVTGEINAIPSTSGLITSVLQALYPVGRIYLDTVNRNPSTVLGFGTWVPYAEGRAIVGVGTGDGVTWTGGVWKGAAVHTLTEAQMPSHFHSGTTGLESNGHVHYFNGNTNTAGNHTHVTNSGQPFWTLGAGQTYTGNRTGGSGINWHTNDSTNAAGNHHHNVQGFTDGRSQSHTHYFDTNSKGGSQPHNNIQPSIGVYVWRRTA